jgi:hypothetical protein
MPDGKPESQHAEDAGQDCVVSGMDLPAPIKSNPRGQKHEDAAKLLHALSAFHFGPLNLQLNRAAV